ncbi:MAG: hypothetical protein CM15mP32_5700 [Flavobacteriaceae bacterium]|nr:MAG: hypothetical protein CM15mP32_5700 [Flavobacteriaceae bacterium]
MSSLTGSFQARVKLKDKKGNLIAKNSFDFDIFDPVVFDSDEPLRHRSTRRPKNIFNQKNISFVDFDSNEHAGGLIISGSAPRSEKKGFNELLKNAKTEVGKGGKLIILDVTGKHRLTLEENLNQTALKACRFLQIC